MKGTTRELPNSAFTTYFGKPAWENYGNFYKIYVIKIIYIIYIIIYIIFIGRGNV